MFSQDAMFGIVERLEELEARSAYLWDEMDHARKLLRKADLPNADAQDIAAQAAMRLQTAQRRCDDMLNAERIKGMEISDAEVIAWADAAGGHQHLAPEAQLRYVGARKRATAREAHQNNGAAAQAQAGAGTPEGTGAVRPLTLSK